MAGYMNNISLGIKLQPSKEVQAELETVIGQLEKNTSFDLKIDTKQINQSLKEFGDTLNNINSQIKNGFNFGSTFATQTSGIDNFTNKLKEEQKIIEQTANSMKTLSTTKIAILNDDGSIKETLKDITKIESSIGKIQTLTKDGKTGIITSKFEDNSEIQRKAEQEKQDLLKQEIEAYKQIDVLKKNGIINEADISKLEKMIQSANSLKEMKGAMNSIMNTSMMNESSIVTISKQLEDAQNKINKMKQSFDDKLLPNGFIESTEIEINKLKEDLKNVDGMNFNGIKNSLNQINNTIKLTNENAQMLTKLENTTKSLQTKLNSASNNSFINPSVISELQNKLNSINTNTAEKEIKELQQRVDNLSSSDSQIVRLQNAISKMEFNLDSMKNKFGNLFGNSSSKSELDSYVSEIEKLKTLMNNLQSGESISGSKLSSEINQATQASRNLNTVLKSSKEEADSFANSIKKAFENAGIYMSAYQVINAVSQAFKEGVDTVVKMDTALGNLNKVVSMTSSQLQQMRDSAIDMGKELGRSSIEIANAQAEFGRLYKTKDEINNMTKVSVMGANVMDDVSSAEVAKSLTTIITSMKLEAKDSMTILDSMNEIQNNYRVSAKDLMNALAEVGSTAYTSGANLQKVEGYITSIAVATGQSGDEVGNALRSVMSRIYKIGSEGIESAGKPEKMLHDMGVEVRDSSGQFREFSLIMDDLNSKWSSYSRTQQIGIAQAVAGVQRYNQFLALMQNYSMATDASTTALNSQGSALKENEIHMQTAEAKLGVLKATTEQFYMQLINSSAIKSTIDGLTTLISTFGNLPTVIGLTTSAIIAFGGKALVSAMSNVAGYITSLISLASTEGIVATATEELTLAMSTNPFGLIAVAIAGITVGLVSLNHAYEESTNYIGKLNEATKGLQELKTTENLVSQYDKLNETINNTTSTTQQVANAKEQLIQVQKQLASQFPNLVDGYTKEGDALVRNIDLVKEKVTTDKNALKAKSESNYNDLINQMNSQVGDGQTSLNNGHWYNRIYSGLFHQFENNITEYNRLLKESESGENSLTQVEQDRLTKLSTKFGDLNKAIITMKDNGQDISGKKMFDFSTGELVDAKEYLKSIDSISASSKDVKKVISDGMNEIKTSGNVSEKTINSIAKAYPSIGINADNAKEKIKELNDTMSDVDTQGADENAQAIAKATDEYNKATQAIAQAQGFVDKLNKAHAVTPALVGQLEKKYGDLGTAINSVASLQDYLSNKIQEEQETQENALMIMKGDDEAYYSEKVANNQAYQDQINNFLNSFVENSQGAYDIDLNNYHNLNEMKAGAMDTLKSAVDGFMSQFVDISAEGYRVDYQNFTTLINAKKEVMKQIAGALADYWDEGSQEFSAEGYGGGTYLPDNASDETYKAYEDKINKIAGIRDKVKDAESKLDGIYAGGGLNFQGFSGGSGGGVSDFSGTGGGSGSKGKSSGSSGSGKSQEEKNAEKAQKEADEWIKKINDLNSEVKPDMYYDENNAITLLDNSMTSLKTSEEGLTGVDLINAKQKEIDIMNKQIDAYKHLQEMQGYEKDHIGSILSNYGILTDSTGKLTNAQEKLAEAQQKANSMNGSTEDEYNAKKDAIEQVKTLNEYITKYNTLVNDTIPKTIDKWEQLANAIKKVNQETLSNFRDTLEKDILKQTQDKVDKLKEEAQKAQDTAKKALEDEKEAKLAQWDQQIKEKQAELDALNDESADNEAKLKKLQAELNDWKRDDSTEAQGKIQNLNTQITDLQKTIKKDNIQKDIDSLNKQKQTDSDDYDKQLKDLEDANKKQEEADEKKYKNMLSEKKAYNEADKLITSNNQKAILKILNDNAENYKDVGTLLGKNFSDAFKAQIEDAQKALNSLKDIKIDKGGSGGGSSSSHYQNTTSSGTNYTDIGTGIISDKPITGSDLSEINNSSSGKSSSSSSSSGSSKSSSSSSSSSSSGTKYVGGKTSDGQSFYFASYDTGGRTPSNIDDGALALLHSDEKILNKDDTIKFDDSMNKIDKLYDYFKNSNSILSQQLTTLNNYSIPNISSLTDLNKIASSITNNTDNSKINNLEINNNYQVENKTDFDTKLFSKNQDKQLRDTLRKYGILKR